MRLAEQMRQEAIAEQRRKDEAIEKQKLAAEKLQELQK